MAALPTSPSKRSEFFDGIKGELPILLGVAPFGMIYGVLARGAGMSAWDAQAMSSVVFAGSAQFMLVQLINLGTPALMMILTGLIINLRHALYSASISPYTKHLSPLWKAGLSYLLTDEAYAVVVMHYQKKTDIKYKHWFFLGAGLVLCELLQLSTAAGIFLGAQVPAIGFGFHPGADLHCAAVPSIKTARRCWQPLARGTPCWRAGLPYKLGLIAAAFVASRWDCGARTMSDILIVMIAVGLLTYLTRLSFILLLQHGSRRRSCRARCATCRWLC
jgi:predicted branched-subunit amino acid permease